MRRRSCPVKPPNWRSTSRAMPRPCAAIIFPMAAAMAVTGSSGDVHDTPGRSLYVRLAGRQYGPGAAGNWTDAATGEHGDLIDLIASNRGIASFREASREARSFLSLPPPASRNRRAAGAAQFAGRRTPSLSRRRCPSSAPRPKPICARAALPGLSTGRRCAFTRRCWYRRRCQCAARVLARPARRRHRYCGGRITGVHRTWLDRERPDKAPLADPRRALGHLLGNGVRFMAAPDLPRERCAARRRRYRDRAVAQIRAAGHAHDRRALGQSFRGSRPRAVACAALRRPRPRCGRPHGGRAAACTRRRSRHRCV